MGLDNTMQYDMTSKWSTKIVYIVKCKGNLQVRHKVLRQDPL